MVVNRDPAPMYRLQNQKESGKPNEQLFIRQAVIQLPQLKSPASLQVNRHGQQYFYRLRQVFYSQNYSPVSTNPLAASPPPGFNLFHKTFQIVLSQFEIQSKTT